MDPELGMGIGFAGRTADHADRLEGLIQQVTASPDSISEVLVEPEGIDWDDVAASAVRGTALAVEDEVELDPLMELFRTGASLTKEQFLLELERHQLTASSTPASELNQAGTIAFKRREPRLAVSLPVQVAESDSENSFSQTTLLIDVSHRGARLDGVAQQLKAGEVVHLVSDGCDARFRVIWVGDPGTSQEGQIGLQRLTTDN